MQNAPPDAGPVFEKVHRLMTASWTRDDKIYILAAPGDAVDLKTYLD